MKKNAFVHRVLLRFEAEAQKVRADVSAIAHTPDGHLWLGSDELTSIERLSPITTKEYGEHQAFAVGDYIDLKNTYEEIDIEGMAFSAGYLWLVGSHSTKRKRAKGKNAAQDIERLTWVVMEENRCLLARLPIVNGVPVKRDDETGRSAAALAGKDSHSALLELLKSDEHIGAIVRVGLPSKENGFDIEAIAVHNHRIFLGLRGPVLRGMAIILEIELEEKSTGVLKLKKLKNGQYYYKHFLDLNGLGIRDLCFQDGDLIVLAGPTMSLVSTMQVYRFVDATIHQSNTLWMSPSITLQKLFDLPTNSAHYGNKDKAEGITIFPASPEILESAKTDEQTDELMIVYDSPSDDRMPDKETLYADVFSLS